MIKRSTILLFLILVISFTQGNLVAQQVLVRPYIQPGNASDFSREEKVLIWQTDGKSGDFNVTYTGGKTFEGKKKIREAKISSITIDMDGINTILYRARMSRLALDSIFIYDVRLNNQSIASEWFHTRSTKDKTKFTVIGDCCSGTKEQAAIAYQIYKQDPDYVLIAGDVVYQNGLAREYLKNYFPYYMAREASPEKGAPLMGKIPIYNVIGNHDVLSADLDKYPDGLAYFYYSDLPLNAPKAEFHLKAKGNTAAVKKFELANRPRFPSMTNYSFDHGNVHMLVIDSNPYVNPLDAVLLNWMVEDMRGSNAEWKLVTFHHPGFNSNTAHNEDQLMRLLSPILEQLNVDLVLSGHVHNYQRTVPLLFDPKKDEEKKQYVISPEGQVEGAFTLDMDFDGVTQTNPKGIIYIISGAGGAPLYDDKLTDQPALWLNGPNSTIPFTARMVSDRHSFTLIETNKNELLLKQIDKEGNVFDEIRITK